MLRAQHGCLRRYVPLGVGVGVHHQIGEGQPSWAGAQEVVFLVTPSHTPGAPMAPISQTTDSQR